MKLFLLLLFISLSNAQKVCTDGFNLINNKCWKWVPEAAGHNDAVRSCSKIGATLFTAKNAIDNRAMLSFLINQQVDHLWMGLYCFGIDRSKCLWDDDSGNALTYGNFAGGFPNMGFGKCVYYSVTGSPGGQWANGDCAQKLPYVCELPVTTPDTCQYNYNNHCYFPLPGTTTSYAISVCDQLCATPASVHSSGENRYLAAISPNDVTLLGGIVSETEIVWMDGTPTDYNNDDMYPVDYTRGPFLSMNPETGDFFAEDNSRTKVFICKRPTGVVCNAKPIDVSGYPNYTSSSNCNNPDLIMAPARISSPGYPGNYPVSVFCTWTISTNGGHRLRIRFSYFNTETGYDLVRVYDGENDQAPLLGIFSAGRAPFDVFTSGPSIYVTFFSDHNHVFQGFTSFVAPVF